MADTEQGYWFKSDLFEIREGEDGEVNPGIYGKNLANWLCGKFNALGYDAELIPEDWGWCVMCYSKEYMLWVGCGSVMDEEPYPQKAPLPGEVIWHVFPEVEVPVSMPSSFIKKLFGR